MFLPFLADCPGISAIVVHGANTTDTIALLQGQHSGCVAGKAHHMLCIPLIPHSRKALELEKSSSYIFLLYR